MWGKCKCYIDRSTQTRHLPMCLKYLQRCWPRVRGNLRPLHWSNDKFISPLSVCNWNEVGNLTQLSVLDTHLPTESPGDSFISIAQILNMPDCKISGTLGTAAKGHTFILRFFLQVVYKKIIPSANFFKV